ncbi:hypothetical protein M3Y97_01070700 [Aphelenchoides bicaudatus]|nr:hypothetical protein M3Y97_01070700 [Aphelenchoides bicaudatus]
MSAPPKLKDDGRRSFLEQNLSSIRERHECLSSFSKFLLASRNYLQTSCCRHYKIYRLILFEYNRKKDIKERTVQVGMIPYNLNYHDLRSKHPETFMVDDDQALKIVQLLQPYYVQIHYSIKFGEEDEHERQFYESVFEQSKGKVSLYVNRGIELLGPVLTANSNKIFEFTYNALNLPDAFELPPFKLDFCKVTVRSVGQLKSFLQGQTVKKLLVICDIESDENEITFTANFANELINESVKELELSFSGALSLTYLGQFARHVRTFFPNVRSMKAESWIDFLGEHNIDNTDQMAGFLATQYQKIQQAAQNCNHYPMPVQCKFTFNTHSENVDDDEWNKKVQNNELIKNTNLQFNKVRNKLIAEKKQEHPGYSFEYTMRLYDMEMNSEFDLDEAMLWMLWILTKKWTKKWSQLKMIRIKTKIPMKMKKILKMSGTDE